MQRFQVTKVLEFSYGHRLLEHKGKCRYLHGHNGMVEVDIESEGVDAMGMVVDFSDVNGIVKTWIDDNLDHKMLLCDADPAAAVLKAAGEPIYLMHDNPTAENIARLIWQASRERGMPVTEVRVWETSTSRASYRGDAWTE
ncbi:MAG: 6-pyruvoyl tetrahydropterin synthase family protein [Dehalococcoidia bacterium]